MNQLTGKQQTRVRIIRAMAKDTSVAGCTASRIAKRARLQPSTVRRHLADMRSTPGEGLSVHVSFIESPKGSFTYRALSVPRVRLPRRRKKTKTAKTPVAENKPVVVLQTRPSEPVSVSVRILTALEHPRGIHELGQVLRIKRGDLQAILNTLGSRVVKQRRGGRWIYSLAG